MAQSQPKTPLEYFDAGASVYEANTGGCTRDMAEWAVQIISEASPIDSSSVILDNACGTGVVSDVLINSPSLAKIQPRIYAADGAANMTSIASRRLSYDDLNVVTAPGENLPFPSDTFSHSITNLGLMFFNDAKKGAAEILRTMKPGGAAVITGWIDLGYVEAVRDVQRAIRPDDEPFKIPVQDAWLNPSHTHQILDGTGFQSVQSLERPAYFGAKDVSALASLLTDVFVKSVCKDWGNEEKQAAEERLLEVVQRDAVKFERKGDEGVGIKMRGSVFLCKKALA